MDSPRFEESIITLSILSILSILSKALQKNRYSKGISKSETRNKSVVTIHIADHTSDMQKQLLLDDIFFS